MEGVDNLFDCFEDNDKTADNVKIPIVKNFELV